MKLIFRLLVLMSLAGCSPLFSKKPGMIMLMVDGLAEQEYLCSESPLFDGLENIRQECDKLIRFTHVFTPSPFIQTQMASLLTGLEVQEHRVLNNGPYGLSARFETLAEKAIQNKMRTAFFSGGVPLFNKFGVTQGYELFNESFDKSPPKLFRSASEGVDRALKWLDEEVGGRSFLMTIYLSDLLIPHELVESELEEERDPGRAGRLRKIFESVDTLIGELKKRKRWSSAHFAFLGVGEVRAKVKPLNPLSAGNTQVPLQIKLAKGLNTNLNELSTEIISFPRIGDWLGQLVQHKSLRTDLQFVPAGENIYIAQEWSVWPWLGLSSWSWLGLRSKPLLLTAFQKISLFESFVDRDEVDPLPEEEQNRLLESASLPEEMRRSFPRQCHLFQSKEFLEDYRCGETPSLHKNVLRELELIVTQSGKAVAQSKDILEESRRSDLKRPKVVWGWLASQQLRQRDWVGLFELGRLANKEAWRILSQRNLRESISTEQSGCLSYFADIEKSTAHFYRICQDSELRKVIDGLHHLREKRKPSESFWAQVSSLNELRRARMVNLSLSFSSDIHKALDFSPSLAELYFFLPENSQFLYLIDLNKV